MVERAGLKTDIPQNKVIPHTLRHTAISWYLRSGVPPHQVSDYCGVSVQIINKVYKHHVPGGFDNVLASSNRLGRATSYATETDEMTQNETRQDATKMQQIQRGDAVQSRLKRVL